MHIDIDTCICIDIDIDVDIDVDIYIYIYINIYIYIYVICIYIIHICIKTEGAKTRDRQIEKIHRLGQASDARYLAAWEAYGKKRVYFHARFMRGSCAGGWPNNMDLNPDASWDRKQESKKYSYTMICYILKYHLTWALSPTMLAGMGVYSKV